MSVNLNNYNFDRRLKDVLSASGVERGDQRKVVRLSNDRVMMEQLMNICHNMKNK